MKTLTLNDYHKSKSAKFVPFAGWNMPISYGSSMDEHNATRNGASLFDVSHMGEIEVTGKNALDFLSFVLTADLSNLYVGNAVYSPICNEKGGTVDDLIVYRKTEEHFILCVNAVNIANDFTHLLDNSTNFDCEITNSSEKYGQLAIQGPKSESIMGKIFGSEVIRLNKMECLELPFEPDHLLVARTGYTGEDGFEIYCKTCALHNLAEIFEEFLANEHLVWAGLAARDSLRLEAGFPLYGNELSEIYSPVQAGLSWSVGWGKENFLGKNALMEEKQGGFSGRIMYYEVQNRRIPRSGSFIISEGEKVGKVLSGGFSPSAGVPIGSAWIKKKAWEKRKEKKFMAEVRGHSIPIEFGLPVLKKIKNRQR
ncbi:MAG: glycine cleavage system protein T [Opitutae bacterium]|nr:glycine cleavage system protein T [Opitutae bacterium]